MAYKRRIKNVPACELKVGDYIASSNMGHTAVISSIKARNENEILVLANNDTKVFNYHNDDLVTVHLE